VLAPDLVDFSRRRNQFAIPEKKPTLFGVAASKPKQFIQTSMKGFCDAVKMI